MKQEEMLRFWERLDMSWILPNCRQRKRTCKKQTADYHKYNELIREGDYYRLASIAENGRYDSWMIVEKRKRKRLYFMCREWLRRMERADS